MANDLEVRVGGDASGAISALMSVKDAAGEFSSSLVTKIGEAAAAVISFDKAIDALKEGINFSDQIRDLALSLNVFTGSVDAGRQAMEFFEKQAQNTRNTALELGQAFRDLFPLANSRGFSQGATEDITVMLSQLATISGSSLDTMEAGFRRILSGSTGAGRNPLLAVLGITKDDIKDMGWDDFIAKMQEVSSKSVDFGQSWDSTMHKIKDAWSEAFGSGFNEAMGGTREAYDTFRRALTNPELLSGVEHLGGLLANVAQHIADIANGIAQIYSHDNTPSSGYQAVADYLVNGGWSARPDDSWNLTDRTRANASAFRGYNLFGTGTMFDATRYAAGANQIASGTDDTKQKIDGIAQGYVNQANAARDAAAAEKELVDATQRYVSLLAIQATYQFGGYASPIQNYNLGLFNQLNGGLGINQPGWGGFEGSLLPSSNLASLGGMTRVGNLLTPGADPAAKSFADTFLKALSDGFRDDTFRSALSDAFVDLFSTGGKNVAKVFSRALAENTASELDALFKQIPLKSTGTANSFGYDANGERTAGGTAVAVGTTGLESGFGGYAAGFSGQSGSRTGAVIEGAISGASVAGVYGAIIGAIAGLIGGALGASQRQADYQYGIPGIGDGKAYLADTKNITPAAMQQITTQIQQEYDQIHSGLIDLLLKFPDVAIPTFDSIQGRFQDNPSAHWGEHLQQWITGTLPKTMIKALGDELATGFEQLGMSKDVFGKLFTFLQGVDPKQAVQDLSDLADALTTMFGVLPGNQSSINDFFHGTVSSSWFAPGTPTSTTFQTGWNQIQSASRMSPGASIAGQYDSQILKDAAALNAGGLSPEEQIKYLGEISSLMKQRYDAEKQAIQQIYDVAKGLGQTADSLIKQYTVQGMVGADGKPDYQSVVNYYQGQSNQDLLRIRNASSAADVDYWTKQYYSDIGATEQAGIQGGGDIRKWSQWAADQIKAGNALAQAQLQAIGQTINTTNDLLNNKLDPALQKYLDGTNAATENLIDFTTAVQNATAVLNALGGSAASIRNSRRAVA